MSDLVFTRRIGAATSITAAAMLLWAVFVVPGGAPWTGLVWLGALAVLLVTSATLLLGLSRTPSVAPVIGGAEAEAKPGPAASHP
jgi:hypothetical protein